MEITKLVWFLNKIKLKFKKSKYKFWLCLVEFS